MADYITREEEFRKLNERLDNEFKKSTFNKIDTMASDCTTIETAHMPGNDRFATFTKSKALPIQTWKKGAGDSAAIGAPKSPPTVKGAGDSASIGSAKSPRTVKQPNKERYGNALQQRQFKSLPRGGQGGGGAIVTPARLTFERKTNFRNFDAETCSGTSTLRRPNPTGSQRKSNNNPTDNTLVLKYKNDRFSTSPSLENLVSDALSALSEPEGLINGDEAKELKNSKSQTIMEQPQAIDTGTITIKGLPKFLNSGSLIRFLKSKVTLLEENQQRNSEEMSQQKEAYEQAMERHKLMQQQRDKAFNKNASLTEQLEKAATQLSEATRRYREQTQESLKQQKELEDVKRELKQLTLANSNLEKRLARTKDELDAAQKSYLSHKDSERELREASRRENETKDAEIKNLKKQRSEIFNAYKKQLFLIDNLKQQNICMEQSKMTDFCEKEFSKVLDWNLKP